MRTTTLFLAAAAAFASTSVSQELNEFGHYPEDGTNNDTTFSTRAFLPTASVGDVCVRVDAGSARGVGGFAAMNPGRINGFRLTIQDSDRSTGESYTCAIIADDPANPGQPDPTNDLVRTGTLMTPAGGTGGVAWSINVTLATPADVLPSMGTYHLAVGLSASSEQSMWAAHYTSGTEGDNPRAGAPSLTNVIDRSQGNAVSQPSPRTMRVFARTENPTLLVGVDIDPNFIRGVANPNYGVAGLFSDRSRLDGLAFRLRDANQPGANFAIFASLSSFNPGPITVPSITGEVHLGLPFLPFAVAAGVLDVNGEFNQIVLPFPLNITPMGNVQYQGVVIDPTFSGGKLSNAVAQDDA